MQYINVNRLQYWYREIFIDHEGWTECCSYVFKILSYKWMCGCSGSTIVHIDTTYNDNNNKTNTIKLEKWESVLHKKISDKPKIFNISLLSSQPRLHPLKQRVFAYFNFHPPLCCSYKYKIFLIVEKAKRSIYIIIIWWREQQQTQKFELTVNFSQEMAAKICYVILATRKRKEKPHHIQYCLNHFVRISVLHGIF